MSVKVFHGEDAYVMLKLDMLEAKMRSLLKISEDEFVELLGLMAQRTRLGYSPQSTEDFITEKAMKGLSYQEIVELMKNEA